MGRQQAAIQKPEEKETGIVSILPPQERAIHSSIMKMFPPLKSGDSLAQRQFSETYAAISAAAAWALVAARAKGLEAAEKMNKVAMMPNPQSIEMGNVLYCGIGRNGEAFAVADMRRADGTILLTMERRFHFGRTIWETREREIAPDSGVAVQLAGIYELAKLNIGNAENAVRALSITSNPPPMTLEQIRAEGIERGKTGILERYGMGGKHQERAAVFVSYLNGETVPLTLYSVKCFGGVRIIDTLTNTHWEARTEAEAIGLLARNRNLPLGAIYYKSAEGRVESVLAAPPEWRSKVDNAMGAMGLASLAVPGKAGVAIAVPPLIWALANAAEDSWDNWRHREKAVFDFRRPEDLRKAGMVMSMIFARGKTATGVRIGGLALLTAADGADFFQRLGEIKKIRDPAQREKEMNAFFLREGGKLAAAIALNLYFARKEFARSKKEAMRPAAVASKVGTVSQRSIDDAVTALSRQEKFLERRTRENIEKHSDLVKEDMKRGTVRDEEHIVKVIMGEYKLALSELPEAVKKINRGRADALNNTGSAEAMAYLTYAKGVEELGKTGFSRRASETIALLAASAETKGYCAAGHALRVAEFVDYISARHGYNNPLVVLHDIGKAALSEAALKNAGGSRIHALGQSGIHIGIKEGHVVLQKALIESLIETGVMTAKDVEIYRKSERAFAYGRDHHPYMDEGIPAEVKLRTMFIDNVDGALSYRLYSSREHIPTAAEIYTKARLRLSDADLLQMSTKAEVPMSRMVGHLDRFNKEMHAGNIRRALSTAPENIGALANEVETAMGMNGAAEYFKNLLGARDIAARRGDKETLVLLDYTIGSMMNDAKGRWGK